MADEQTRSASASARRGCTITANKTAAGSVSPRALDPFYHFSPNSRIAARSPPADDCTCVQPTGAHAPHRRRAGPAAELASPAQKRRRTLSCPGTQIACAINPLAKHITFECLDVARTLDSCGGCLSEGLGADCTQIDGADEVACVDGACVVHECQRGWEVGMNGTSCVRAERKGTGKGRTEGLKAWVVGALGSAEKVVA
jgi:hypothetical protein